MPDHDLIPLTHLGRELVAGGFVAQPPSYDRLYRGALNAAFPCEQVVSNRWSVRRGDLPKVAAAFGLAPIRANRAAVEHAAL